MPSVGSLPIPTLSTRLRAAAPVPPALPRWGGL